jgi:imidazolonepropionase-like amidohydrolase
LHEELKLMVEAGLTPMQAIQTATINPATYLGMNDKLGTVEEGKIADLVLLDANPLEDISNTAKIHAVVANGRLIEKTQLQEMIRKAKAGEK